MLKKMQHLSEALRRHYHLNYGMVYIRPRQVRGTVGSVEIELGDSSYIRLAHHAIGEHHRNVLNDLDVRNTSRDCGAPGGGVIGHGTRPLYSTLRGFKHVRVGLSQPEQ